MHHTKYAHCLIFLFPVYIYLPLYIFCVTMFTFYSIEPFNFRSSKRQTCELLSFLVSVWILYRRYTDFCTCNAQLNEYSAIVRMLCFFLLLLSGCSSGSDSACVVYFIPVQLFVCPFNKQCAQKCCLILSDF